MRKLELNLNAIISMQGQEHKIYSSNVLFYLGSLKFPLSHKISMRCVMLGIKLLHKIPSSSSN